MIPLYVILGVFFFGVVGISIYIQQNSTSKSPVNPDQNQATISAAISESPPTLTKLKPTLSSSPTSKLTPKPTVTTSITPTQALASRKNTCNVNIVYGKLGGTKPDPLMVTLVYSFSGEGDAYMTGAQWDFNGDGNWDTDMSQSNGTVEHTYSSGGNYNVKLRLQASDGSTTDVCSETVSLQGAIEVSLKGQVYRDTNCNDTKDEGEEGVGGISFTIMSSGGLIYQSAVSDSGGNYSFSKKISVNDSLPLILAPNDHSNVFPDKSLTLNSQNYSATVNIPLCSQ